MHSAFTYAKTYKQKIKDPVLECENIPLFFYIVRNNEPARSPSCVPNV